MDLASILVPTMLIDREKVRANIAKMADKARSQGIRFRPHFKTHQSAVVGGWFRDFGVEAITVSSLDMALYFARSGWRDITVAFPLNLRQLDTVQALAAQIHLGVLVESVESIQVLGGGMEQPLDVWIKVDSGSGRTGIDWRDGEKAAEIRNAAANFPQLSLCGLLTHAGLTYSAGSVEEVCRRYQASNENMRTMQGFLQTKSSGKIEISVGDTPGCSASQSLGAVDEIRPGNFVFYDAQMLNLGICPPEEVAAVIACPVVALHPEREEAVIYGGAVHLSKDYLSRDGKVMYGYVALLQEGSWGPLLEGAYAARLSQEHGILHIPSEHFDQVKIGGLIGVIPAHVCLAVSALGRYVTLDGEQIHTLSYG